MKNKRGFAAIDKEKMLELAKKGGANVPNEKRSFSQSRELAKSAGQKGGKSVQPWNRSFYKDRNLAAAAGRKGGKAKKWKMTPGLD